MTSQSEAVLQSSNPLVKFVNRASLFLAGISAIAILVLMIQVIVDVVGRTFFNHPMPATLEFVQYWWMVLISLGPLGYAQMMGENVRATILVDRADPRTRRWAEALGAACMAVLAVLIAFYGFDTALESTRLGESKMLLFSFPIWPMKWMLPIGGAVLFLQSIVSTYLALRGHDETVDLEEEGVGFQ